MKGRPMLQKSITSVARIDALCRPSVEGSDEISPGFVRAVITQRRGLETHALLHMQFDRRACP